MKESRKLVSWRLEKLEKKQQEIINEWLDNQHNIQLSLTNVVLHMIDRFGTTDIMNYDNQKALYTNPDNDVIMQEKPMSVEVSTLTKATETNTEANSKVSSDEGDSLYADLERDL